MGSTSFDDGIGTLVDPGGTPDNPVVRNLAWRSSGVTGTNVDSGRDDRVAEAHGPTREVIADRGDALNDAPA